VGGHDVHAQGDAGVHHVLGVGPQGGGGTLPGVAAVQQQGARAGGAHLVHQGLQVGEAAHLAVGAGGGGEVDVGEGVGVDAARLDVVGLEEMLADQVGHLADGVADAQVDVGLAEIDGLQLGMAVGHVHERHVAEGGQVVIVGGRVAGQGLAAIQGEAGGAGGGEDLEEFAAVHGHD
jgi:hypothetical protein